MSSVRTSISDKSGALFIICAISTLGSPTLGGVCAINVNQTSNDGDHIIKEEYSSSQKTIKANKEDKIINEISSYLKLEFDWDGYEGKAPKKSTVINAIDFAKHLINNDFSYPKATLSGSGAVGLYWERQDFFAEVDFDDEGYVAFFAENGVDNEKLYSDDFLMDDGGFKDNENFKPLFSFLRKNFKDISTYKNNDKSGLIDIAFAKSAFSQGNSSFYSL